MTAVEQHELTYRGDPSSSLDIPLGTIHHIRRHDMAIFRVVGVVRESPGVSTVVIERDTDTEQAGLAAVRDRLHAQSPAGRNDRGVTKVLRGDGILPRRDEGGLPQGWRPFIPDGPSPAERKARAYKNIERIKGGFRR